MNSEMQAIRRSLSVWAARLIVVALVTGIYAAAALTDTIHLSQPRLALGAHLSGLMGGLWMLAIASTFDLLKCSPARAKFVARLVTGANWGNWGVTLFASLLGVNGLTFTHDPSNNLVAVLLQLLVVVPSLIAAGVWAWSF